jgi:hypothetical protein
MTPPRHGRIIHCQFPLYAEDVRRVIAISKKGTVKEALTEAVRFYLDAHRDAVV